MSKPQKKIPPKKISKKKNLFFYFIISIVSIIIVSRLYYILTDDFRIANISDNLYYHPEWNIPELSKEEQEHLDSILAKDYSYLGMGGQTYVFESGDKNHVIKFFKFKNHRPRFLARILPPFPPFKNLKQKHYARCNWKYKAPFNGYKLAFDQHKEESGLIYIHLNQSSHFQKNIIVKDKLGFKREIALDKVAFVIQKRGEVLKSILSKHLAKGNIKDTKDIINQMIDLYLTEFQKGLYDKDFSILNNTGIVQGKVFHLDVGQLIVDVEHNTQDDYMKTLKRKLDSFLAKHFPQFRVELATTFDDLLAQKNIAKTAVNINLKQPDKN